MKVRILGCGTSSGVPRIGGDWGACDPAEPRNRRSRASILIEHRGTRILVDTGPDLRAQLLDAGIGAVDAVIWTHDHADHCHGIDDLRQVFHHRGSPVPVFARLETLESLRHRFAYAFEGKGGYPPVVVAEPLEDRQAIGGIAVAVADQTHGDTSSAGLRFTAGARSIGYSTDISELSAEAEAMFRRVDVWIVDALRAKPHPSHAHLGLTLSWIGLVQPSRAILTHMDQSMDYSTLRACLPDGVEPGYDGLEVTL